MTNSSLLYAANIWDRALERLGRSPQLDRAADAVESVTKNLPDRGPLKDTLSGTWLGHALHPMLTDLPIGFWTSAFVFDLLGEKYDDAASMMVGLGIASSIPTAMTGAADWNDTSGASKRVGAVHALVNSSALACYVISWGARKRGRRAAGIKYAMVGATFATVGGFLGGHLVDALGVGVDNATFDTDPEDWTETVAVAALSEKPTKIHITPDTAILLTRHGDDITAVSATCPHRGAPLDEGAVDGDVVTCPWHGSEFSLVEGTLLAGPAVFPLRCYDVRVREDADAGHQIVEVRAISSRT